jgi:tetratricopeptide (TPR) repeat protein
VSKKPKQKGWFKKGPAPTTADLRAKINKALRENRSQQALELARTLYKQESTPQNKELLKKACLARGNDLLARGHDREAGEVFTNALSLDQDPGFLAEVAKGLAATGNIAKLNELLPRIPDPTAQAQLQEIMVDEAVHLGSKGRPYLSPELQPQLDAILKAAAHVEKGEDEAAREQLQAISLKSPFLMWKLFLRGLAAFYQNDDARALENWQRLPENRWPFRLAAPLRFLIDPKFAAGQPPATQNMLRKQADQMQSVDVVQKLRQLQAALSNDRQLPSAFRQAEVLVPRLKKETPNALHRLSSCFYWAIIHHGMPEDVQRYRRIFGAPPADPELDRLEAFACEERGQLDTAHEYWQSYEKSIDKNNFWPPEQKKLVRALVWQRMGENADHMPEIPPMDEGLFFGRMTKPKPLKPTAAECYERSLQLAPDQLKSYENLFHHYRKKEKLAEAEKTARALLERFPAHVDTLEELGDLVMEREKYAEAMQLFQRALQANPLENRLRGKMAAAQMYHARTLSEQDKFDEARALYQSALAMQDRNRQYEILCKWSACEFKAKNPDKAEELLEQAQAKAGNHLAVVFNMLIEVIRFKLSKIKPRFHKEFDALLKEPPTGAAAAAVAGTAASYKSAGVKYHGQQTHEKKVKTYLEKARKADFTEEQLREICYALGVLENVRLHHDYIVLGQKQFPKDPFFYMAEVQYHLSRGPYGFQSWRVTTCLKQARKLAMEMPRSEYQQELLQNIQKCEEEIVRMNPFANIFGNIFGGGSPFDAFDPFGGSDDYDDDYEDDEDGGFF